MKQLKMLAVVAGLLFAGIGVQAQTKIGYIDAETILYLMPEIAKIDSQVQVYQRDTIGREFNSLMETYQFKDSIWRDSSGKVSAAVKEQTGKELQQLTQTLQNWQQIAQEAVQNKQSQLLGPVMKKIQDAIRAVAKEKGYAYVLSRDAVIVAPDADDLLQPVAKKLNITIPPQLLPGYKPPTNPGGR